MGASTRVQVPFYMRMEFESIMEPVTSCILVGGRDHSDLLVCTAQEYIEFDFTTAGLVKVRVDSPQTSGRIYYGRNPLELVELFLRI